MNLHEKINNRQRVNTPHCVTVIKDGIAYTVPLEGHYKGNFLACCRQPGGPDGQRIVLADEVPGLIKKRWDEFRLQEKYNGRFKVR